MAAAALSAPTVFEYLDLVTYLQDYYQYRKKLDKGFSYEAWAAELEFKSRSFLRMMVVGKKKLTPKVAEAIAQNSFQTKDEREYFFVLMRYSQSSTQKDRQIFGQKLLQILKNHSHNTSLIDGENLTSDPLMPRLLSLFGYEDVETTLENLAKILNLHEEQVLLALKTLQNLGLAENQEGTSLWSSQVAIYRVPDNKGNLNLRRFHEKSLREALEAFDKPKETRRYKSLFLPMSPEDYENFNVLLDDFAKEQMLRHNPKTYKGKRLFQMNFNIYPVSETGE